MKLGIVAHTSIDHIINKNLEKITIGGPTYYAGLAVKRSNIDAKLITKVGYDFKPFLSYSNELVIDNRYIVDANTTRFMLVIDEYSRRLFLLARCEDITIDDIVDMDGYIVSPIINEVSIDTLNYILKNSEFTFLDPQGFVRRLRDKECYLARTDIKTDMKVGVIKVDEEEAFFLTGLNGIDALMALNAKISVLTTKDRTFMLYNDKIYSVKFDAIKPIDSTGAGDIFMGVYASSYIKDKDVIWAYASAIAASLLALKSNKVGLDKIPSLKMIEEEAENILKKITIHI